MNHYFLSFLFDDTNNQSNAICINDQFFTYRDLKIKTASIVQQIKVSGVEKQSIGVYLEDNLETYAAILAIWVTGNKYIPLHPTYPASRIDNIVEVANIKMILAGTPTIGGIQNKVPILDYTSFTQVECLNKEQLVAYDSKDIVYVLFTSGSTGVPKGVQINYNNLKSFLENLDHLRMDIPEKSGYLQMFELTFDLSIVSILLPLMNNGILYHVSTKAVKYLEIYRLLEEYPIQFAIIVPSVLSMLRPYFNSIQLPNLRYVALSGEAVPLELTQQWQACCPNARFYNFYGPTECTIFCTYYEIPRTEVCSQNGIVSIGKVNLSCKSLCLKEDGTMGGVGEKALLWIGGDQVSPGYLNNEDLNTSLFMDQEGIRYYNTGDVVTKNDNEEFFYLGRKDHQVKISGYRIELSEVEFNASKALNNISFVLAVSDEKSSSLKLVLFILKTDLTNTMILSKLKETLPDYMLPSIIIQLDEFPLNKNGKMDRGQLKEIYERQK
jgi:amino acid adenylation domain-containing protein